MRSISHIYIKALGLTGFCLSMIGSANSEDINQETQRLIATRIGKIVREETIEKITESRIPGLFEILTPKGIVYTDAKGSFAIFNGTLIDSTRKTNLTEERLDEYGKFSFSELPLENAIETTRGDGSRILAIFADPNCVYCKRLEKEILSINNIRIYTFLVPILSADSKIKIEAIWCSENRAETWKKFMLQGTQLVNSSRSNCAAPIDSNLELYKRFRLSGTPAILFKSGQRFRGATNAEAIEKKLND